jgi:hypothetical protein
VTLNGHLIPGFLFHRKNVILAKIDHRFGAYFRRKKILVYHEIERSGFLLIHNKKRFFKIWVEAVGLTLKLLKKRRALIEAYRTRYPYLTSKAYWEKQFFPDRFEGDS